MLQVFFLNALVSEISECPGARVYCDQPKYMNMFHLQVRTWSTLLLGRFLFLRLISDIALEVMFAEEFSYVNCRIGFSMISDAEAKGAITPGKVNSLGHLVLAIPCFVVSSWWAWLSGMFWAVGFTERTAVVTNVALVSLNKIKEFLQGLVQIIDYCTNTFKMTFFSVSFCKLMKIK